MVLFAAILLVAHIHRRFPSNPMSTKPKKRNFLAPFKQRYSLILLSVSMTGALAGILIDFQFYAAAASSNMGPKGNASFFANFYILLNFSSLLVQLFATPKIQNKIGLRGGLMVLPLALTGGATFATAAATALSRSLLRVTEGGLRSSVHRSIWEQAFIPIDAADRSTVKLLVDGIGARVAEAIGAALILFWFSQKVASEKIEMPLDTRWISWIILATAVSWVLITRALRAQTVAAEKPTHTVQDSVDCERFPDQCPCTTELGKGVP
jgi:ATP/ADP translocase